MIVRRKITHGYTSVPRAAFEDARLSYEARGLLGFLLVKPDDWTVNVTNLARSGHCGRDRIYRMLDELKAAGYLTWHQSRQGDSSRFAAGEYIVTDTPSPAQVSEKPETENPYPGFPDPEKPGAYLKPNSTKNELDQTPTPTAPIPPPTPAATAATGDAALPDASRSEPERTRRWDAFFAHIGAILALDPYQKRDPRSPAAWARDLSNLLGPLAGNDPAAACVLFDEFTAWAKRTRYGSGKRWDFLKSTTVNEHAAAWARNRAEQRAGSVTNGHDAQLAAMLRDEARYGMSAQARAREAQAPGKDGLPF